MDSIIYWSESTLVEKMITWRDFRSGLYSKTLDEVLSGIATFWAKVPYGNTKLNLYEPSSWPSAWEMLDSLHVCSNMISLLIFYTFKLSFLSYKVELAVVHDTKENFLVAIVEDKYILNYAIGEVLLMDEFDINIIHLYTDIKELKC